MKNWRGTLTTILRSAGGKAHLSEIYPEADFGVWSCGKVVQWERDNNNCENNGNHEDHLK